MCYVLVSAKHRETKQFFTLYNTLNDTHEYLNRELKLLSSISDNYHEYVCSICSLFCTFCYLISPWAGFPWAAEFKEADK